MLLLALIGLGALLTVAGHRTGSEPMKWIGIAILIPGLGFVGWLAFVTVACWSGHGCI